MSFIRHKNTSRLFSLGVIVLYKVSASRIHVSSSCFGCRSEYRCLIYSKKKTALFYNKNTICLQMWSGGSSSTQIYRTDGLKRHQVETRLREGTRSSWPTATIVYLTLFFPCRRKEVVRLAVRNRIKPGKGCDRDRRFDLIHLQNL